MSGSLDSLAQKHHAFYEVLPYYVFLEERHGSVPAATRRVQAGFEVEVYGVNTRNELAVPGADPEYALGYVELKKLAQEVSRHTTDSCSLEVIPLPAIAVLDARDHNKVEAMLRVRISHGRGLGQPANLAEQRALEEVENQLQALGIARR